jgi:hypothetical protein
MGRVPAEVWAMTPADTALLVEGWNAAQGGDMPKAMSRERLEELKARYPDG